MRNIAIMGEIDAATVANVVRALHGAADLTLTINSQGGSAFAGLLVYVALKRHRGSLTVIVENVAASAASLIAMAGDRIIMHPGARMMVHEPSANVDGSRVELRVIANLMDRIARSMIEVYARRSGLPSERVAAMLTAETWMKADEAVALGFADEVADATSKPTATLADVAARYWAGRPRTHAPLGVILHQEAGE